MRKLRALALLLVVAAVPGCFLDEIDKSMANYKSPAPPPQAGQPAGAASAPAADAGKPGAASAGAPARPAGPSWWQTARTLGSDPIDETIAACAIDGRVEFQRRDDCLARGGRPK